MVLLRPLKKQTKLPDNLDKDKLRKSANNYMKYSGMAIQMGAIILVGVLLGQKLDEYFQTDPYITVAMALFSIFAALYSTLKDLL